MTRPAAPGLDPAKPEPTNPEPTNPEPTNPEPAGPDPTVKDPAATTPSSPDRKAPALPRTHRRRARWRRARPSGPVLGLVLTGILVACLLVAAGAAGAYVVPRTAPAQAGASGSAGVDRSAGDDTVPAAGDEPDDLYPSAGPSADDTRRRSGRPSDALAGWAVQVGARLEIPAVALQAYGYAELALAKTTPTCRLSWTTLAGIGKIESNHGRANGATLTIDGKSNPPIIGLPLDGQAGRDTIRDTDGGTLDRDSTWDRAVGPMQFIPSSWQRYAIDADADGVNDPNDIDDAALTAAAYLCATGRDLSTPDGWYGAILTYNAVRVYANDVFTAANDYGVRSRNSI